MTYYTNAVVLYGLVMVGVAVLTLGLGALARSEAFKAGWSILTRVGVVWGLILIVIGLGMGFSHSKSHPECVAQKAAGNAPDACTYFFTHYGE